VHPKEAIHDFLDALGMAADQIPSSLTGQIALYRSLLADKRMIVMLDNALNADDVNVRGAFSWSYGHLDGEAARTFRLLAIHPGPDLTAAAAASLTGAPPERALVRPG
jgi:hypothetical protein